MEIKDSESNVFCGTSEIIHLDERLLKDTHSDIKVFKIELSKYYDIVNILMKTLTFPEVKRAERYRRINDKNRFIICRSMLRYLIANERQLHISEIQFEKNSNHKPYFPLDRSLFFNVSHSGDFAIIAIGTCELGVDIEFVDNDFDYNEILNSVFNEKETAIIRNSDKSRHEFYKFWTRKEAIVKAIGKGIDDDFLKIPITDGFHSIPSSVLGEHKNVKVLSFNLNDDYVGAIAITEDNISFDRIVFCPTPTSEELKCLIS